MRVFLKALVQRFWFLWYCALCIGLSAGSAIAFILLGQYDLLLFLNLVFAGLSSKLALDEYRRLQDTK